MQSMITNMQVPRISAKPGNRMGRNGCSSLLATPVFVSIYQSFHLQSILAFGFFIGGLFSAAVAGAQCSVIPGALYVNDSSRAGSVYTTAAGNDLTGNGTTCAPYATIQKAISMAQTGNTIYVDAGTYREDIVLDKPLTLRGANDGINPNGAGPFAAPTVIQPFTSDPATGSAILYLENAASGTTIDGFTFDGDNTTKTSGVVINGADLNAAEAIGAYAGISNATIRNNIIKNLNYAGIDFDNFYNSSVVTSGNTITNNKLLNIFPVQYGAGIVIADNCYANVTNNKMDSVRLGIQTGEFSGADPGNSHSITGNTITSGRVGIWYDAATSGATPYVISNNTINTYSGATNHTGLLISSLQGTAAVTIANNTVTGAYAGVNLWNNTTALPVTVGANTFTNCNYGVFANNYDGFAANTQAATSYIVNGAIIQNAGVAGIYVKDNGISTHKGVAVTITGNTVINTTTTGLKIEGGAASADFTGTTPAAFTGQSRYIDQVSNGTSVPGANINATAVILDGQTGATATLVQNFSMEDKINHQIDSASLGFVLVKAGNDFVTPNSYLVTNTNGKIQRGVNAAGNGFTENVQAGTYAEHVNVNKPLTISGPNSSINPNTGSRVAEAMVVPDTGNITSGRVFDLNAATITIKGFTINGDNPAITGGTILNGADINAATGIGSGRDTSANGGSNMLIENNILINFDNRVSRTGAVYGTGSQSTANSGNRILNNRIDNSNSLGIGTRKNFYASIRGNVVTRSNRGILVDNYSSADTGTTAISGNEVRYYKQGITVQNHSGSATPFMVSQNKLVPETAGTNEDGGTGAGATNTGIRIWSITGSGGATISGNRITNAAIGEELWNNAPGKITGAGDTILNAQTTGIRIATLSDSGSAVNGSYATITRDSISSPVAMDGILVTDNDSATATAVQLNLTYTTVSGGTNSIRLTGPEIDATTVINNNSFTGAGSKMIDAFAYTGSAPVSATCNWYSTPVADSAFSFIKGQVTYIPYLSAGTDAQPATAGFQPVAVCTACTALTATFSTTANTCNGNTDGTLTASATGGTGPYTYSINPLPATYHQPSAGRFTGLPAGSYTITAFGSNGCSTQLAPVTVTQPAVTNPDVSLSLADYPHNFTLMPGASVTILYKVKENNGGAATNDSLRITKQSGYTLSFPNVSDITIGGTVYPVDNLHWTAGNANAMFYKMGINAGNRVSCSQTLYLALTLTRNTSSQSSFALTSLLYNVPGDTVLTNNANSIFITGQ